MSARSATAGNKRVSGSARCARSIEARRVLRAAPETLERHPKLSPRFGIEPIASVGEVTGTSQSLPADLGTPPWPGLFAQLRGSEVP
jgi:hypothetical protein